MDNIIMEELLDDDIDPNIIATITNELAEPFNNIGHPREEATYNKNYIELIIPNYSLSEFKRHFRLSRHSIEELCLIVAPLISTAHKVISLETKILFYIWLISKQESFLAVSDRFGFSSGTGHYIFIQILDAIVQLKHQLIIWPNNEACVEMASKIENRYGLPGTIGIIDGCHIPIKQPVRNAVDFYNRNNYHSVVLQGVCNDKCIFTDVFIGMPGRVHDARVFRSSPLYARITADPPLIPPKYHLLGDEAYPLMRNVLKPFRDNGHLSNAQNKFNRVLSAQRSAIERTFGLLKGRWRRLKYLDMSLEEQIPRIILSACILHNFASLNDGHDDIHIEELGIEDMVVGINEEHNEDETGTAKRNYIANLLL